ncbi:PFL_4669 family integrating conjugative element protein [Klebsiella pneumoniae]|uniref:PFL_4669 family integrating conjugative element protein n=1 Tax=Enterobacterales TaxID=91347 RepID=UPI0013DCFA63|nr:MULTISPECIES: TIGR03761 family integrating conjugative element protein [Enterobacterales]EDD5229972.1 TIGR03761 family integrating conjugative element protein [Salmonella enterica]ELI9609559.1 TIGR03761 family integrating conjugative element protein [Klebsiella pneumoniae]ELQ4543136.1 TIGR03761 family integrating conjugative element protein [Klebsiella pneumoniae]WAZ02268.1 TIGR03761 family integrating conjugative element protein [Serratia marcescens]
MSTENETRSDKPGGLTSTLKIEIHSNYAIRLWEGRPQSQAKEGAKKSKHAIMSMPQAIKRSGVIYQDSLADNPWADEAMFKVEILLNAAGKHIQSQVEELEVILKSVPPAVSFSDIVSTSPLNIGVFSRSPLGYRCVWVLVGYDQMALKAFQAAHFGLISRNRRDELLSHGAHLIRKVYGVLRLYRTFKVTRSDIAAQTNAAQQAEEKLGKIDPDILSGNNRSSFSPPLRKAMQEEK